MKKLPLRKLYLMLSLFTITFSGIVVFLLILNIPSQTQYIEDVSAFDNSLTKNLANRDKSNTFKKINLPIKNVVSLPIKLRIPRIRLNAKVEYVGLTANGILDTPKGIVNVGWYDRGPIPGEIGSSIIDGHYGWKKGRPAVFNNLYKLKKGDKIYIDDAKGKTLTFIVNKTKVFGLYDEALEVFDSEDKKAHLNIITCNGVWDKKNKIYKSRLVIFTDKVIE